MITTTYKGIEINYDEMYDKWRFTLRGKDRSADTLSAVRKAIDAPAPKDDTFRRFEAWHGGYGGNLRRVTVTSIAENGRLWISYEDKHQSGRTSKERGQASIFEIYPCSAENDAVVARLLEKEKQIKAAREELETMRKELRVVEPKDWQK